MQWSGSFQTGGRLRGHREEKATAQEGIPIEYRGNSMKKFWICLLYTSYFIDLDGTMYRGSQIIEGAKEFIDTLTKRGERFVFLTNNAKRTKRQNVEHMEQMGFTGIREEHFFTSSMAAARYAAAHYEGRNVWYIGQDGPVSYTHLWYDNENSYTSQMVRTIKFFSELA